MYLDHFCVNMMNKYPGVRVEVREGTFIAPYVITRISDGAIAQAWYGRVEPICAGLTDKIGDDLSPDQRQFAEEVQAEGTFPHIPGPPVTTP